MGRLKAKKRIILFCFLVVIFSLAFTGRAHAGLIFKILGTNPSKTHSQTVNMNAFLPKEVKLEHIIDSDGLEVGYDAQAGAHYVYGEHELEPLEVLVKEIEIMDVWVISGEEIKSLHSEAEKLHKLLRNTEFAERMEFLYNSIVMKLSEIEARQRSAKAIITAICAIP